MSGLSLKNLTQKCRLLNAYQKGPQGRFETPAHQSPFAHRHLGKALAVGTRRAYSAYGGPSVCSKSSATNHFSVGCYRPVAN